MLAIMPRVVSKPPRNSTVDGTSRSSAVSVGGRRSCGSPARSTRSSRSLPCVFAVRHELGGEHRHLLVRLRCSLDGDGVTAATARATRSSLSSSSTTRASDRAVKGMANSLTNSHSPRSYPAVDDLVEQVTDVHLVPPEVRRSEVPVEDLAVVLVQRRVLVERRESNRHMSHSGLGGAVDARVLADRADVVEAGDVVLSPSSASVSATGHDCCDEQPATRSAGPPGIRRRGRSGRVAPGAGPRCSSQNRISPRRFLPSSRSAYPWLISDSL